MELNLSFWPEHDGTPAVAMAVDELSVARHWCDPALYQDIVGVDFGLGKIHCYSAATGRRKSASIGEAVSVLLSFPAGTLLVCEWAHLAVCQTSKSLSQPFTEAQLRDLYSRLRKKSITLKLFPHAHSGSRAREWVAHRFPDAVDWKKTSDMNDAVALALFVKYCNEVSLANPPSSFAACSRRDYGRAVTRHSNIALNAERTRGYAGSMFPAVISVARDIRKKSHESAIDLKAAISIASTIVGEIDGRTVMFCRKGAAPGAWFWLRNVMRFSPWHHRGGIARSNLMKHRFRPFAAAFCKRRRAAIKSGSKYVKFAKHDGRQKAARVEAMRAFRAAVLKAYRIGVAVAAARGFDLFDPLAGTFEVNHGR